MNDASRDAGQLRGAADTLQGNGHPLVAASVRAIVYRLENSGYPPVGKIKLSPEQVDLIYDNSLALKSSEFIAWLEELELEQT